MSEWVNQWLSEWVSEWVSEWADQSIRPCVCSNTWTHSTEVIKFLIRWADWIQISNILTLTRLWAHTAMTHTHTHTHTRTRTHTHTHTHRLSVFPPASHQTVTSWLINCKYLSLSDETCFSPDVRACVRACVWARERQKERENKYLWERCQC